MDGEKMSLGFIFGEANPTPEQKEIELLRFQVQNLRNQINERDRIIEDLKKPPEDLKPQNLNDLDLLDAILNDAVTRDNIEKINHCLEHDSFYFETCQGCDLKNERNEYDLLIAGLIITELNETSATETKQESDQGIIKTIKKSLFKKTPMDFKLPDGLKLSGVMRNHLFNMIKKHGLDYKTIDTYAILDSTLTYQENKELLEAHLNNIKTIPTENRSVTELRSEIERYDHYWEAFEASEDVGSEAG